MPLSLTEAALTAPEAHNPEVLLHDGNLSLFVYGGCHKCGVTRCGPNTTDPVFPPTPECVPTSNINLGWLSRPHDAAAGTPWHRQPILFVLSNRSAMPGWWTNCSLHNSNPSPLLLEARRCGALAV